VGSTPLLRYKDEGRNL